MVNATRRAGWSTLIIASLSLGCLTACSGGLDEPSNDEETTTWRGELKRVVISDPERGTSRFEHFLELPDGAWLALKLPAEVEFEPNSTVVVRGSSRAGTVDVLELEPVSGESPEGTGTLREPLIAASPKRVAVLLFNFSNDTSQPIDAARAKELVFTGASSSNAYFKEVSFGVRSLVGSSDVSGDVLGWYTIDQTNSGCAYADWGTAARAKAQAAGVNFANYDYVVHYFPRASGCQFSGVGQLPGKYNWINGSGAQTIAHELGHNFGIHHASSYRCVEAGVPAPIGGTCTASEYGDPFDVMGSSYRHIGGYHKEKLGFLEPSNVKVVTASGSFELAPLEQKSSAVQVLRFAIPGTTDHYYVEYRQPFGFDSFRVTDPVVNGVLIRRVTIPTRGVVQTKLIDNAPSTTSFSDAPLLVGRTFTDAAANVSFTLTARTASAATVTVTVGGTTPPDPDPVPTPTCPSGEVELAGHCYYVTPTAQTFSAASSACAARGAGYAVASIESAAENTFLSSLIGGTEHWIGATDSALEGTFVWPGGQTFWSGGASGAAPTGVYANFLSGEPNASGDCVRMTTGGTWRDASCSASYRAICEK